MFVTQSQVEQSLGTTSVTSTSRQILHSQHRPHSRFWVVVLANPQRLPNGPAAGLEDGELERQREVEIERQRAELSQLRERLALMCRQVSGCRWLRFPSSSPLTLRGHFSCFKVFTPWPFVASRQVGEIEEQLAGARREVTKSEEANHKLQREVKEVC